MWMAANLCVHPVLLDFNICIEADPPSVVQLGCFGNQLCWLGCWCWGWGQQCRSCSRSHRGACIRRRIWWGLKCRMMPPSWCFSRRMGLSREHHLFPCQFCVSCWRSSTGAWSWRIQMPPMRESECWGSLLGGLVWSISESCHTASVGYVVFVNLAEFWTGCAKCCTRSGGVKRGWTCWDAKWPSISTRHYRIWSWCFIYMQHRYKQCWRSWVNTIEVMEDIRGPYWGQFLLLKSFSIVFCGAFRNCDEDHCYMKRPDDTDSCILSSTHSSIDIDIKNLTRGVTCNQDTGSDPVIKPTKPVLEPARNNGQRRIPTSSPEAEVFVWEPCFRGRFMKVVRVQFPERPAKNYTCNANAVCVDTVLRARGVCFTTEDPLLAHDDGVKNSATLFTLFFAFAVASVLHLL